MNKTIRPLTPAWMDTWIMNLSPDGGEGSDGTTPAEPNEPDDDENGEPLPPKLDGE